MFSNFVTDTDMWLSLLIGLFLSDLRNIYAITLNFGNPNQVSQQNIKTIFHLKAIEGETNQEVLCINQNQ